VQLFASLIFISQMTELHRPYPSDNQLSHSSVQDFCGCLIDLFQIGASPLRKEFIADALHGICIISFRCFHHSYSYFGQNGMTQMGMVSYYCSLFQISNLNYYLLF
jgi:hypothetical protein